MTAPADIGDSAIYAGIVSHKRLRPKPHALSYGVFSLFLDLERLDALDRRLTLFSHNRWNLFSFHDRDHGTGDGTPLARHVRELLSRAGHDVDGGRLMLLCYPRVLGYVFNPLSVVYAFDRRDQLAAVVYEVNNTFGERRSYVLGFGEPGAAVHAQHCAKEMFVSPFAPGRGDYGFRITRPGDDLLVAVMLRDAGGPLLKTMFQGRRRSLNDASLLRLAVRYPLLTLKVIGAIHLEALKLWLKGIPVVRRHRSPRYSVSMSGQNGLTETGLKHAGLDQSRRGTK